MDWIQISCRLLAAMGLGGLIGLERQFTSHSVGIRTCVWVCMGSCLFTAFPYCIPDGEVSRMAAQIISGVGFLGSGIIFKDGFHIRGINTAATIWCTAGVGIFAGAGLYLPAVMASALLFVGNILLRALTETSKWWGRFDGSGHICEISLSCSKAQENTIRKLIVAKMEAQKRYLLQIRHSTAQEDRSCLQVQFIYAGRDFITSNEQMIWELSQIPTVRETVWRLTD